MSTFVYNVDNEANATQACPWAHSILYNSPRPQQPLEKLMGLQRRASQRRSQLMEQQSADTGNH